MSRDAVSIRTLEALFYSQNCPEDCRQSTPEYPELVGLQGLADSDRLVLDFGFEPKPNVVILQTADELDNALRAVDSFFLSDSEVERNRVVRHEVDHSMYARRYKAFGSYGLAFFTPDQPDSTVAYETVPVAFNRLIEPARGFTKLQFAAICAGPIQPSKTDEAKYKALGYRSREEVLVRAMVADQVMR